MSTANASSSVFRKVRGKRKVKSGRQKIAVGTSGFDGKSDSNFLDLFHTNLRLEYLLSTKINYIYHGCSNHSNLEIEAKCLAKNLSYLNLNISRTKNGRNKL